MKRVLLTGMSGTGSPASPAQPGLGNPEIIEHAVKLGGGLRTSIADHEIRTTMPLGDVVAAVLSLAEA